MKKQDPKKLVLKKDTIQPLQQNLTTDQLKGIVGGATCPNTHTTGRGC